MRILRLNKSGFPTAWLSREDAVTLYVKQRILWYLGDNYTRIYGGVNRSGVRSMIEIAPIIACDDNHKTGFAPALNNRLLFRRDDHRCMYCGTVYNEQDLTRDHILPKVLGGKDRWTNVVTACRGCNHIKGGRTPEQAGMELLAIPFEPNVFEFMYLANRQIMGDQMAYLRARFSGQRHWEAA